MVETVRQYGHPGRDADDADDADLQYAQRTWPKTASIERKLTGRSDSSLLLLDGWLGCVFGMAETLS